MPDDDPYFLRTRRPAGGATPDDGDPFKLRKYGATGKPALRSSAEPVTPERSWYEHLGGTAAAAAQGASADWVDDLAESAGLENTAEYLRGAAREYPWAHGAGQAGTATAIGVATAPFGPAAMLAGEGMFATAAELGQSHDIPRALVSGGTAAAASGVGGAVLPRVAKWGGEVVGDVGEYLGLRARKPPPLPVQRGIPEPPPPRVHEGYEPVDIVDPKRALERPPISRAAPESVPESVPEPPMPGPTPLAPDDVQLGFGFQRQPRQGELPLSRPGPPHVQSELPFGPPPEPPAPRTPEQLALLESRAAPTQEEMLLPRGDWSPQVPPDPLRQAEIGIDSPSGTPVQGELPLPQGPQGYPKPRLSREEWISGPQNAFFRKKPSWQKGEQPEMSQVELDDLERPMTQQELPLDPRVPPEPVGPPPPSEMVQEALPGLERPMGPQGELDLPEPPPRPEMEPMPGLGPTDGVQLPLPGRQGELVDPGGPRPQQQELLLPRGDWQPQGLPPPPARPQPQPAAPPPVDPLEELITHPGTFDVRGAQPPRPPKAALRYRPPQTPIEHEPPSFLSRAFEGALNLGELGGGQTAFAARGLRAVRDASGRRVAPRLPDGTPTPEYVTDKAARALGFGLGAAGAGVADKVEHGDKYAHAGKASLHFAVRDALNSGRAGITPNDEKTISQAIVSGNDAKIREADFLLRQRYPTYARLVEKALRDMQEKD